MSVGGGSVNSRALVFCLTLFILTKSASAKNHCVIDPSPNEPQCNWESRMAISKLYGFSDLSRAEMNIFIEENPKLRTERNREYDLCMKKNNFC